MKFTPLKEFLIFALISAFIKPTLISASTVAIVSGRATQDGRPLLMKLRDNTEDDQEYFYCDVGPYAFIGITYTDITDQAWGGINEVGFAIVNSNAWNFNDPVPGPDDDGYIMYLALRTCATVLDFQHIMDSTNAGRTRCANYGVIDSTGSGAFFEAAAYTYYRHDLDDSTAAPNGYMVRANFAYSGGTYHLGQHRHDRALALLDSAFAGNFITHRYITQVIQRDLVNEVASPYPLPFQGRQNLLPYGIIRTHDALNRDITRSGMVIQCALPGENPLLSTLWALLGEPVAVPALPLWVHAEAVPPEFDSPGGAPLNQRAQQIRDYLYRREVANDALDTWLLTDERNEGVLPLLMSLENQAETRADSALAVWRAGALPDPAEVAALQNDIAAYTYSVLNAWSPPMSPTVTITRLPGNQIQLNWEPVTYDVFNRPIVVSGYTIYSSVNQFYNRLRGDSLMTVSSPPVILTQNEENRLYQVRCLP